MWCLNKFPRQIMAIHKINIREKCVKLAHSFGADFLPGKRCADHHPVNIYNKDKNHNHNVRILFQSGKIENVKLEMESLI